MDLRGAVDLSQISTFKKAKPPALGPAFNNNPTGYPTVGMQGAATILFDLDRLTLDDYKSMRWHPQINASLSLITFMLHQQDWHIECEDKKIADAVEENLRLIWSRLIRAISQAFWAGHSPNILEWDNDAHDKYTFITKIKDMPVGEVEVNWKEVESSYRPPTDHHQTVPKVKVYDGIKRVGTSYPVPVDLTFWYPLMMENGDYSGRKLLKPAFTSWYFSVLMHLWSNRYFERFGEPVPIGRAPFDADFQYKDVDGTTRTKSGKQVMEDAILQVRSRSIVVLPSDRDESASSGGGRSEYEYDIEYLESQMRGADFERYMARLDEEMSLAIFTPMLLLRSGDVGSNALGVQHTQTWLWSLNALAGDIKEYIDRYICQRIKAVNFSPKAPRVEWVPKKMGKENPETIRSIISAMITAGMVKPSVADIGTALGMKMEEIAVAAAIENPDNPGAPAPAKDTRDRPLRVRTNDRPRTVGEPMATGRSIAARIEGQVSKNWQTFSKSTTLSMGHKNRLVDSFVAGGWTEEEAKEDAAALFRKMEGWLEVASEFGDEFESAKDFVEVFARRLTQEITDLAAQRG